MDSLEDPWPAEPTDWAAEPIEPASDLEGPWPAEASAAPEPAAPLGELPEAENLFESYADATIPAPELDVPRQKLRERLDPHVAAAGSAAARLARPALIGCGALVVGIAALALRGGDDRTRMASADRPQRPPHVTQRHQVRRSSRGTGAPQHQIRPERRSERHRSRDPEHSQRGSRRGTRRGARRSPRPPAPPPPAIPVPTVPPAADAAAAEFGIEN